MGSRASSAGFSKDPAVKTIVSAHRTLTAQCAGVRCDSERGTLVACSGGADSTALAISLASSAIPVILAHVVHDVRPVNEAMADRDYVQSIASAFGVPFVEASIRIRELPGNLEANARRARYRVLARLAGESGIGIVATGHQADDVLETILMRLMRGTGPRGLTGPASIRRLSPSPCRAPGECWLVRPMLTVSRADAERICGMDVSGPGSRWRRDLTNDDRSLLRNAVRARIVPIMRELAPGVELRAAHAGGIMRDVVRLLDDRVALFLKDADQQSGRLKLSRRRLADQPRLLIGEILRCAIAEVSGGVGLDRIPASELRRAVGAVRDDRGDTRTFGWGSGGRIRVVIERELVFVESAGGERDSEADCAGGALRT